MSSFIVHDTLIMEGNLSFNSVHQMFFMENGNKIIWPSINYQALNFVENLGGIWRDGILNNGKKFRITIEEIE